MTENKLRKFISKPREPPSGKRTHQPIILTDSKGNYLKKYACHDVEKQIVWLPKSGAKIEDSTQWLKSNISKKIINYGDIWLYVWMGTCNLTSKNKKYISLKSENDEEVDKIISKCNEIIKIINRYPGTKVTFLETPVYSIKNWNESKGHKDPNVFVEQDENLSKQIYTLNGKVREINNSLGTHSPDFSSDLRANDKYRCGKDRKLKTKKYYNFKLYSDGIHPDSLLSKTWLRKISEQAKRDCWERISNSNTN